LDKSLDLAETETETCPTGFVEKLESNACRSTSPARPLSLSATMISTTPVDAPGRGTLFFAKIAMSPPSFALHIDQSPLQSSIVFRVSIAKPQVSARRCFGECPCNARRGKSPLAMESINGRYCNSPHGVMP
jgi:hypothetical protein